MDMPSLPLPLPRAAEVAGARAACFIHVVQPNHSFWEIRILGDWAISPCRDGDSTVMGSFDDVCLLGGDCVGTCSGSTCKCSPRHIYHLYTGILLYMYSNVPSEHLSYKETLVESFGEMRTSALG